MKKKTQTQKNTGAVNAKNYFLRLHAVCVKSLQAYNHSKSNDKLHQLRVSIKKIKALLVMIHYLDKNFDWKKAYAPYKPVFKSAGIIRSALLQNQKLKYELKIASPETIAGLNQHLKTTAVSHFKKAENKLALITARLEKIKRKQIVQYCALLLKPLKKRWKKETGHTHIHRYRKQVKHFLYCINLLTPKERGNLLSEKKQQQFEKLQNLIGQWHDNNLLLNSIEKGNLKAAGSFVNALQEQNQALFQKVIKVGKKI